MSERLMNIIYPIGLALIDFYLIDIAKWLTLSIIIAILLLVALIAGILAKEENDYMFSGLPSLFATFLSALLIFL